MINKAMNSDPTAPPADQGHDVTLSSLPSPTRIFSSLIAIIFFIEFIVMWLLVLSFGIHPDMVEFLTDSTLLSLLSAPFIWGLIIKPLRGTAQAETKRAETLMHQVAEGVVGFDGNGNIESFNTAAENIFGYASSELIGSNIKVLLPESGDDIRDLLSDGSKNRHMIRDLAARCKDGSPYHMDLSVSRINMVNRHMHIGIMRDISERRKSEKELTLAANIFENIGEATIITDADNNIVSVNPAFTAISGYAREEVIGKKPSVMKSGRHDTDFYKAMWSSITDTGHWQGEVWDRRKNGEIYPQWLSISALRDKQTGKVHNHIAIYSDITERKQAEERIQHMAHHDALTGLPNRILLHDRLAQDLSHASRNQKQVAVLFLDLDRFKTINDSLGHTSGDILLQSVAGRLKSCLRSGDTVARLGGDEFIVVLPDIENIDYAALVARKLLDCIADPHAVGNNELNTTASIGISIYPHDGPDIETIIMNADVAMYKSKEAGRDNFMFFTKEMNASAVERLALENSLRKALDRKEFELYFQPQVDSATSRFIGAEALIRWLHPEMGLVMPAKFIPIAEESGLIVSIGEWVLRTACAKNIEWQKAGLPRVPVAVNLSALQFRQKDLLKIVKAALEDTGLEAGYLELEITESSIIQDAEAAIATLKSLKSMGVRLSIDDFGTGYSNLAYLKRFPIDKLKIDQSFVRDLTTNPDDAAIVRAIINLATSLKLKVIAEGVETEEHLDFLKTNGCDELQGYYFSRPVPDGDFRRLLER